jgi:hypothetical protein
VLDRARLTAGALADDADELDFLLTRGRKDHVRGLIVAGRTIVEGGTVRSVDLGAIEFELWAQARKAWPDAMAGDGLRQRHWNALADFYGCDCHRVS